VDAVASGGRFAELAWLLVLAPETEALMQFVIVRRRVVKQRICDWNVGAEAQRNAAPISLDALV
jgi:hypothetical protein